MHELAKLEAPDIHAPWEAAPLNLAAAGVTLGKTYPEPIVEHGKARTRALAAFGASPRTSPQPIWTVCGVKTACTMRRSCLFPSRACGVTVVEFDSLLPARLAQLSGTWQ